MKKMVMDFELDQLNGGDLVVRCTPEEDRTRQEYRLQTEISYQIQRMGVGPHPAYGDQDFAVMDLTTAMQIVDDSRDAWMRLPAAVRERFGSWKAIEAAARSGELQQILKAAGVDGGVVQPASTAAASASDSAAVEKPDA